MTLTLDRCRIVAKYFNLNIDFSDQPGLDILEEVEMRCRQGEDWQDFLLALQQAEYHDSVEIFKRYYTPLKTEKG